MHLVVSAEQDRFMPDSNPTPLPPTPTPSPDPEKKPARERFEINPDCLDEISGTDKLADVSAKTDYATTLAKRNIDAAFLTKINVDHRQALELTGQATGKTTNKKLVINTEKDLRDALIAEIQSVLS